MSYAGVNVVGLQRRNFTPEQIAAISQVYHILFVQGHSTSTALQLIAEQVPESDMKTIILDFVHKSGIGIIKRFSKNAEDAY